MLLMHPGPFFAFATALESGGDVPIQHLIGSFDEIAYACLGTEAGVAAEQLVEVFAAFEGLMLDPQHRFDVEYDSLFREYPPKETLDRMTLAAWARTAGEKLSLLEQVVSLLEQLRPAFPTR